MRALRQRPLAEGVSASTITQPDHTRADDIEVIDADLHRIVVGQPGPVVAPTTCQPYGWHVDWAEAPVEQLAARP